MRVNLSGHHVDVTPALRSYVERKLARVLRRSERVIEVQCTLTVDKLRHRAESVVHVRGPSIHASAEAEDMYAAIDALADKDAIADYLRYERPSTSNRALFVRCLAPRDAPISADTVCRVIRDAYRRIGLNHGRTHALRHSLARRMVEHGSSIKEVADVLRHRSLNTTLIYAKLDTPRLAAVALPWPGSVR